MKEKIKVLFLIIPLILFFQGCTGVFVSRGKTPYETIRQEARFDRATVPSEIERREPKITRAQAPYETREQEPKLIRAQAPYEVNREIVPARLEAIYAFPADQYRNTKLKLGSIPVRPVSKNTVTFLQEEARKQGLVIFINRDELVIETQGGDGRWYRGRVEAGTVFLAKLTYDLKTGVTDYELVRLGICWNPVRNVTVRQWPVTQKIVERYRDTLERVVTERYNDTTELVVVERYRDTSTQKIVERYQDIDYTPALWAGLGGLIVGGALGWILHPAISTTNSVTTVIKNACPAGICGPGAPGPIPPVP